MTTRGTIQNAGTPLLPRRPSTSTTNTTHSHTNSNSHCSSPPLQNSKAAREKRDAVHHERHSAIVAIHRTLADLHQYRATQKASRKTAAKARSVPSIRMMLSRQQVLMPDRGLRVYWDLGIVLLVLYNMVSLPLSLAFGVEASALEIIVDLVFMFDILLNFRTAYHGKEGQLVFDSLNIAWHYIASWWFIIDVIASIPWNLIFLFVDTSNSNVQGFVVLKALKVLRLLRLSKLLRYMNHKQYSAGFNVLRLGLMFLMVAHWFACLFHMVAQAEDSPVNWQTEQSLVLNVDETSPGHLWLLCFYWSVVTITTVGYGDISPVTLYEKAYTVFVISVGTLLYMSVFGAIAAVVAKYINEDPTYAAKMKALSTFMNNAHMGPEVKERIRQYYMFVWKRRKGFGLNGLSVSPLMDELPDSLRMQVATEMYEKLLLRTLLFRSSVVPGTVGAPAGDGTSVVEVLSVVLSNPHVCTNRIFLDGEFLFHACEPITQVFFLDKGIVQLSCDSITMQLVDRGSVGHAGLFSGETEEEEEEEDEDTKDNDEGQNLMHVGNIECYEITADTETTSPDKGTTSNQDELDSLTQQDKLSAAPAHSTPTPLTLQIDPLPQPPQPLDSLQQSIDPIPQNIKTALNLPPKQPATVIASSPEQQAKTNLYLLPQEPNIPANSLQERPEPHIDFTPHQNETVFDSLPTSPPIDPLPSPRVHVASALAVDMSDVFCLDAEIFMSVVLLFPRASERMRRLSNSLGLALTGELNNLDHILSRVKVIKRNPLDTSMRNVVLQTSGEQQQQQQQQQQDERSINISTHSCPSSYTPSKSREIPKRYGFIPTRSVRAGARASSLAFWGTLRPRFVGERPVYEAESFMEELAVMLEQPGKVVQQRKHAPVGGNKVDVGVGGRPMGRSVSGIGGGGGWWRKASLAKRGQSGVEQSCDVSDGTEMRTQGTDSPSGEAELRRELPLHKDNIQQQQQQQQQQQHIAGAGTTEAENSGMYFTPTNVITTGMQQQRAGEAEPWETSRRAADSIVGAVQLLAITNRRIRGSTAAPRHQGYHSDMG